MDLKLFLCQIKAGIFLWFSLYKRSPLLVSVLLLRPYLVLIALFAIEPSTNPLSIIRNVLISILVVSSIDILWDVASNALSLRFLGILPYIISAPSSPSLSLLLSYLPKYILESVLKALEFLPLLFVLNSAQSAGFLLILLLFSLVGVLPLLGLSSLIAYTVLSSKEETVWLDWLAPLILLVSGALYPVSLLPPWLQLLSRLFPTTYLFEIIQLITENGASAQTLLGLAIMYLTTSILLNSILYLLVSKGESELLRRGIHL
ncbi:MAG: hypothetical protein ACP5II_02285 [Infirmifilum sp.]|jgi:ABC-2 type transport system permease protein|uniref:hypothetical protein n=1 Tax=Infirmifilum TaxID=2856573 RepID=UPI002352F44E